MRILVIEDDSESAGQIGKLLKERGHEVDIARDGLAGLAMAFASDYDALIVDRMLPGLDGLSVVQRLRAAGKQTGVLILTTMTGLTDRVEGLEGGADDYLTKPFSAPELLARVHALGRRGQLGITRLTVHDLEIDLVRKLVHRGGRKIDLQPQEFRLLQYLMLNAGRAVTRKMLLENVWELHFDPRTNIVETHMSRLRGKVDRGYPMELIHTVRGTGYVLRAE